MANRLQTALLVLTLIGIGALAGGLLFGESALWIAVGESVSALLLEPVLHGTRQRNTRTALVPRRTLALMHIEEAFLHG